MDSIYFRYLLFTIQWDLGKFHHDLTATEPWKWFFFFGESSPLIGPNYSSQRNICDLPRWDRPESSWTTDRIVMDSIYFIYLIFTIRYYSLLNIYISLCISLIYLPLLCQKNISDEESRSESNMEWFRAIHIPKTWDFHECFFKLTHELYTIYKYLQIKLVWCLYTVYVLWWWYTL